MTNTLAYKGDPKLKEALVAEIKKQEEQDAIIRGTYGKENGTWKGCAVACSLRSFAIVNGEKLETQYSDHERYDEIFGAGGHTLGKIEDRLFEDMEVEDAKTFPRRFAEAIEPGADLSNVPGHFLIYVLNDTLQHKQVQENEQVVKAIKDVVQLWQDIVDGKYEGKKEELKKAAESAAESAESAARSAAESAESAARSAESAARSAESAESAAWSAKSAAWSAKLAAWSAESAESAKSAAWSAKLAAWSAISAAWSAESAESAKSAISAAWSAKLAAWSAISAAEYAACKRYADELLRLLSAAPVSR